MKNIIVVSQKKQIEFFSDLSGLVTVLSAEQYLKEDFEQNGALRVFNLCNDYSYLKRGYYVSLLGEARNQRPLPSVSTIVDFDNRDSIRLVSESISDSLNRSLRDIKTDKFEVSIYFGKNTAEKYASLSKQVFNIVQAPLLRVFCEKKNHEWFIKSIKPISFKDVPETHYDFLKETMRAFFGSHSSIKKPQIKKSKYDLAILVNEKEEIPPSNLGALKAFIKAADDMKINAEIINSKDFALLSRFDALFIRETTSVLDHTYKFAKRAEIEGLVVIDDPQSILRCCNKVYLHNLLNKKKISTPKTWIIDKDTDLGVFTQFPLIIKKPDSAFSAGVKKVNSAEELDLQSKEYFKNSDLLILQEFLLTDFDWRIGVIDGEPLYACRYHMAKNHWQIISREDGSTKEGSVDTLPLYEVPPKVIKLALTTCEEIGTSLYGVDIKEKDGKYYIIEVNDNPSIEKGWEDRVMGQELYNRIMSVFLKRLEAE